MSEFFVRRDAIDEDGRFGVVVLDVCYEFFRESPEPSIKIGEALHSLHHVTFFTQHAESIGHIFFLFTKHNKSTVGNNHSNTPPSTPPLTLPKSCIQLTRYSSEKS